MKRIKFSLVRRGFVQIQRDDEMLAAIVREVVEQDSQRDISKVDVFHPVRLIAHDEQRTVVVFDERIVGNVAQDVLNGMHTQSDAFIVQKSISGHVDDGISRFVGVEQRDRDPRG